MPGFGGRLFRLYKLSFVAFVVGLPALGLLGRDLVVPGYLWLKEVVPMLMHYENVLENSALFMNSLFVVYLASLGFVVYLFLKNCKRSEAAPYHGQL